MERFGRRIKTGDFFLIILTAGLVVFGIIMVFSSSYYTAINDKGDPYYYLKRDIVWAVLGFFLMTATTFLDYKVYARTAPYVMGISAVLLALIFTPLGVTRNYATRWLGAEGFPVTIMPGEIAKIAVIIFVSWYLSSDPTRIRSLTRGILPLTGLCVVCAGMIVKQPNLSTAITVSCIIIGIMFVAGLNVLYLAGLAGTGAVAVSGLVLSDRSGYWFGRLTSFMDPFADPVNSGYQAVQSLLALGSGGIFGLGLGKGLQKNLYLPEPQNDFILAIIGEELGFIGCILLFAAYVLLIWRGMHIALGAPDMFGTLLASGITIMVAVQVLLNIAVVTSSMPPTGITLPFISYGGNALLLFMGSMGILLNISRHSARWQQ
ncbi:MAG: putative lipid II flippase FtsW [Clostridiales bacterium]|nr:putative lipid II flippase FtsW [Clostridiales bacterium]